MSEINEDFIEIACELIDGGARENKRSAVAAAPPRLPAPSELLQPYELAQFQKLSDARVKKYEKPAPNLRETLDSVARFPSEHLSHATLKKILLACACKNIDRVHCGSAADTLLTAIPAQLLKLPFRYIVPAVDAQLSIADALPDGLFNRREIDGASKVLQQPALGANRTIARTMGKPSHQFGFWGKGVKPGVGEPNHAALVAQFKKAKDDVNAILAGRCANPAAGASDAPANNERLEALRDGLATQIEKELQQNLQYLKVMAFDDRLAMQAIMTVATISAQMVARVAAGALLAPVGLVPLVKLVAPIVSVLVAPLTQATMNWQDTKSVGRAVVRKYCELERDFGIVPEAELRKLSHFAQDHFQSSRQANYERRFQNVVAPTIRKLGIELAEAQYRKEELELRSRARTEAEHAKIEKILVHQRELNAVNRSYSPKYLTNAQTAVDELIEWADPREAGFSNEEFEGLLHRRAFDILTVEASPSREDAERLKALLAVDAKRFGRTELRDLGAIYRWKEKRMTDAAAPHASRAIGSYSVGVVTVPTEKYKELNDPLMYLQRNLEILRDRSRCASAITKASNELAVMAKAKVPGVMRSFELKMEEIARKTKTAQEKCALAETTYRRYLEDAKLFQEDRLDRMDANGKFVEQLRSNTSGVRVTMSNLFKHDLWDACKSKFFSDIGVPFGESIAFNAIYSSIGKTRHSLAIESSRYEESMTPETYSALEKKVLPQVRNVSRAGATTFLPGSTSASSAPGSDAPPGDDLASESPNIKKKRDLPPLSTPSENTINDRAAIKRLAADQLQTRPKGFSDKSLQRIESSRKASENYSNRWQKINANKAKILDLRDKVEAGRERIAAATKEHDDLSVYAPWNWKTKQTLQEEIATLKNNEKEYSPLIAEYDAWVAESPTLQSLANDAFAALSPLEKYFLSVSGERSLNEDYDLDSMTRLVEELEKLPLVDRGNAFLLLCECEPEKSVRASVLTMLAEKIDCLSADGDRAQALVDLLTRAEQVDEVDRAAVMKKLFLCSFEHAKSIPAKYETSLLQKLAENISLLPPTYRLEASMSVLSRIAKLPKGDKLPLLDEMIWSLEDVAGADRKTLFDALLSDTGGLDANSLKLHLDYLTSEVWRLQESDRLAAITRINKEAEKLDSAGQASILEMSATLISSAPADLQRGLFDRALAQIQKLNAKDRLGPLEAMAEQLSKLPSKEQIGAFHKYLASIRTFIGSKKVFTPPEIDRNNVGGGRQFFKHPATTEYFNVYKYLDSHKDDSLLARLLANAAQFDPRNRKVIFDKSLTIALETDEPDKRIAWIGVISQLEGLSDKERLDAFKKIRVRYGKLKGADKVEFLLANLSHFPVDLRFTVVTDLFQEIKKLPRGSRVDAIHALALQLEFLPQEDLLPTFKKILEVLGVFRSGLLTTDDATQMFVDIYYGMVRLKSHEVVEADKLLEDFWDRADIDEMRKQMGLPVFGEQNGLGIMVERLGSFQTAMGMGFAGWSGTLPSRSSLNSAGYRIFTSKSFHLPGLRFRDALTKHFTGITASRVFGRKTYSVPNTGYTFTKQCFVGGADSPQLVKKKTQWPAGLKNSHPSAGILQIEDVNLPGYVMRGDSRPIEDILRNGFTPRGTDESMRNHLSGTSGTSAFVSTTRDPQVALQFAMHRGADGKLPTEGWRIKMEVPPKGSPSLGNWFDIEASSTTAPHNEIAVKGPISANTFTRLDKVKFHKKDPNRYRVVESYARRGKLGLAPGATGISSGLA